MSRTPRVTDVSVVIPARNAAATIGRTLAALGVQQTTASYEVIVVDDGSTDDTVAIARAAGARVLEQNAQGPTEARNRGAAVANAGVLAFTDADCFPDARWVDAARRAVEGADFVQGAVRPEREAGPFDRSLTVARQSGLWEAANIVVKRDLFVRLGGFEEWVVPEIGKSFGEDMWLGWRAVRAGAAAVFDPAVSVEHAVFERGPAGYVDERRRLRYFPPAAKRMPELRDAFFYRRVFLSQATAEFDLAVAGVTIAAVRRSPLPLVLAAPFARRVARRALPYRRRAPLVAATEVTAHAVGLYALLRGSATARTPVL
jgi:glycosyltransferase involved in cell wall biosynthesis